MRRAALPASRARRSTARLFAKYALIGLIPVLALGIALAITLRGEAQARGLSQARDEALLISHTAIEPLLSGRPLSAGLSGSERRALTALVARARPGDVLRLRLHDLAGNVVWSDDGTGFHSAPEDEAKDAARGILRSRLTHLNTDANDRGKVGVASVEVYQQLVAGHPAHPVGVLEMYLPYGPIAADVGASLDRLYVDLAVGLALLYLALFAITASVSRGLRRQLALNADQEERLRSSEERYRLLFERNPQPMMAFERTTLRMVAVSNSAARTYGYTPEEFVNLTLLDIVPEDDQEQTVNFIQKTLAQRTGPIVGIARRHRYKDGTIIDVEITSDDIVLGGRDCRIALCLDVTERNRANAALAVARDEAVEASNMKSAFLANMSHEIRTPMNGVIGMNELLLDTELSDEQRSYAEQVSRSGEQMLTLINDILDISKIEAGRLELDTVDFDLHETVDQVCSISNQNVLPRPGSLVAPILPPISSTNSRAIASPRPVPP